jgi:2-polyprenyl-3-methyl-5-hydroxy-6-metoxy-1,4-benzoquinol methylase
MIKITPEGETGPSLNVYANVETISLLGRMILPLTRLSRARNAERYITPALNLLDVGCGNGYFIRRSKCTNRYGIDRIMGEDLENGLNFDDSFFDFVTVISVLEYIKDQKKLLKEIHRVLKFGGRMIVVINREKPQWFKDIFVRDIMPETKKKFLTRESLVEMCEGLFKFVASHRFLVGTNLVVCFEKSTPPRSSAEPVKQHS